MARGGSASTRRAGARPQTIRRKLGEALDDAAVAALFHDGKDPAALRTIGEVARALGVPQHVLRYWESQFLMLRPLTRSGGRRYYRHEDIALAITIHRLLHREGYTIRGALGALAADPVQPPPSPPPPPPPSPPARQRQEPVDAGPLFALRPEAALVGALDVLRSHVLSIRQRLAAALD